MLEIKEEFIIEDIHSPIIKNFVHFFIDFENVHENGFEGINYLKKGDRVTIFISERNNKMNINILAQLQTKGCPFNIINIIGNRKNAMDFQLIAELSFEMGVNKENNNKYVIISKDKDFHNILIYHKNKGFIIKQNERILDFYENKKDIKNCQKKLKQ